MFKRLLFVVFLLAFPTFADDYAMYFSYVGTATGAASSSAQKQIGTSVAYHKLAWNKSGTVSKCEVVVEQSATGTSGWTDLVTAQTCTSNGTSVIFGASANYVRITFSTPVTGTGSVTASYSGYINLPLTDPPLFASWTAKAFVYSNALKQAVTTAAPTDGQILIGKTGDVPVLGSVAGTTNQITSTPGAGTITLSTPQDIATTSTPQFARLGAGQAADATAPFAGTIDSATTNTILDVLKLTRSTTGTAGNGIGTGLVLYAEDASGNIEEAGRFQGSFPDATHATQTGRVDITAMGAAAGTGISVLQDGNVGIGTVVPVGRLQTKFTATTPIIFATGDTLGSYTSVTFPTANKDYANKTGICTACAVGDLVIITAGTGAYTGQYSVLLKISDNSIRLSRTCHNEAGDIVDGAVSIVGQPRASFGSNRHFFFSDLNAASGNENAFVLNYRVNKVAGNSTGLQINATHDLAPGTNLPFQVNVGGVEKFSVSAVGQGSFAGQLTVGSDVVVVGAANRSIYMYPNTATFGHNLSILSERAASGSTNQVGGNLIAAANYGTGNATASQFIVQTPTPIGTGTTDQTLVTRTITDVTGQTINYGHLRFISEATPGAPTSNAPTAGGSCTAGAHSFVTTFVTSNGETQYGAASAAQTCGANATVPLSAIPTGTSGVTTGRNICASKAGTTTPLYQVGASPTIADNSTTTYDFVTADGSLTVACNPDDTTTGGIWVDGTQRLRINPVTGAFSDAVGYWNISSNGTFTMNYAAIAAGIYNYKGISTVSNGVPAIYGTVDLTAQTSAIGATTIYANPATTGQYRVCYLALTKKAGDAVNLAVQLSFTTPDDSSTAQSIASANVAINTVGTYTQGCPTIVAKASTNIQYATTLSGGIGAGEYSLWIKVEKL